MRCCLAADPACDLLGGEASSETPFEHLDYGRVRRDACDGKTLVGEDVRGHVKEIQQQQLLCRAG